MAARRLFLDTGVLHRLADGKFAAPAVKELHEAVRSSEVRLLLTGELLHDALSSVDHATRERFARALLPFGPFQFVLSPPYAVEPLGKEVQDIPVIEVSDLFGAIGHWPPKWFDPATLLTDKLFAGIKASVAVYREEPSASFPVRQEHFNLLRPALSELMNPGRSPSTTATPDLPNDGSVSDRARDAMSARLRAAAAFLAETGVDENTAAEFQRHIELDYDPSTSPARAVVEALVAEGKRDLGRSPMRSDIADALHAGHFPYVDIATCDSYVHSVLSRKAFAQLLRFPRTPRLIRNGELDQLIAVIREPSLSL